MITLSLEEEQLKEIVKQALVEILEERQDLAESIFLEALEDYAMLHAIQEGESSEAVDRDKVFDALEDRE